MILDTFCLALVVYVEARGEEIDGQLLVAETVINRQQDEGYPDDLCGVAFDHKQFSGVNDEIDLQAMFTDPAWETSILVAEDAISGNLIGSGATHYHTTTSKPYWSEDLILLGMYGNHIFYKDHE